MENIRIKAILAVAAQLVLDHYRSSHQVIGINFDSEQLKICQKNAGPEDYKLSYITDGQLIHSQPESPEKWSLQLPCDIATLEGWFHQLTIEQQREVKARGNLRPLLTLWDSENMPSIIALSYSLNCLKLANALQGQPQIITDADYVEITPILATGWQLVTMVNPHQVGSLDTLVLMRKDHSTAIQERKRLYGITDEPALQEAV